MNSLDFTTYEIYSETHNATGTIIDCHFAIELNFQYNQKKHSVTLKRTFPFSEEALKEHGIHVMESYIEKLLSGQIKERRLMLHYWYIKKGIDGEDSWLYAKGIVTGHTNLQDSTWIRTSAIEKMEVNTEAEELIIHTKNSIYHCPLLYCRFDKQDAAPDLVPEYEEIKANYQGKLTNPSIEPGKVLLVLSNFDEYYFHSLYYQPEGSDGPLEYTGHPHIGTFQDSFLIQTKDYRIDLRYFPHYQNIEFYLEETDGHSWFLENIGDIPLYAKTSKGTIRLEPGDRKEVTRENAEKNTPILPGGDLYPAQLIE